MNKGRASGEGRHAIDLELDLERGWEAAERTNLGSFRRESRREENVCWRGQVIWAFGGARLRRNCMNMCSVNVREKRQETV